MNRARLSVVFALLGTLGLWGCAQNSTGASAKTSRLQEEVTGLCALRDQLRKELKAAQSERDTLQEETARLRLHVKERDEQLVARTTERDQNATNLDTLKKGIKSLMDQALSMGPMEAGAVTTASLKPTGGS
jgi:outer membrane murein-binding lipoprotein Lpp